MTDNIINFYDTLHIKKSTGGGLPKTFENHHILNNSMILAIGQSGTGKTNALLNYLARSAGEFHKIIIVSFSTTDEPLYKAIKERNPNIVLIDNIEDVPNLTDFDDKNKDKPKLIVFDDFINLSKKEMSKINPYLISGRKFGFSVFLMARSYVNIPKIITRNIMYFIIFRLNDNVSIDRIIHNHNISTVNKELFKRAYILSTAKQHDFMMIDLKSQDPKDRFRNNFLKILKLTE